MYLIVIVPTYIQIWPRVYCPQCHNETSNKFYLPEACIRIEFLRGKKTLNLPVVQNRTYNPLYFVLKCKDRPCRLFLPKIECKRILWHFYLQIKANWMHKVCSYKKLCAKNILTLHLQIKANCLCRVCSYQKLYAKNILTLYLQIKAKPYVTWTLLKVKSTRVGHSTLG